MKNFNGIEVRNIEIENDEYKSFYVDKNTILFYYPNADLSTESSILFHACEYLENHEKYVVSCENAKINEMYYSKPTTCPECLGYQEAEQNPDVLCDPCGWAESESH